MTLIKQGAGKEVYGLRPIRRGETLGQRLYGLVLLNGSHSWYAKCMKTAQIDIRNVFTKNFKSYREDSYIATTVLCVKLFWLPDVLLFCVVSRH